MVQTGEMRTLGSSGDVKQIWDKSKPDEVSAVKKTFKDLVDKKKYLAFKAKGKNGEKGDQIHEFDPGLERIILTPPMVGG